MRIKKVSSTAVLKGNVINSLVDESTVDAPSISAVKNNCLTYVDNNYPTKPKGFTIVRALPSVQESGILYFVCPLPSINIHYSVINNVPTSYNSDSDTIQFSCEGVVSGDILHSFSKNIPTTYQSSFYETEVIDPLTEQTYLGIKATRALESTYPSIVYSTFEMRNPETTALEWWGSCSGSGDGTINYILDNETGEGDIAQVYLGEGSSYSFYVTISYDGGLACLVGDTLIKTKDGFKAIKDIQVGDIVFDKENKEVLVTKIYSHDTNYITKTVLNNNQEIYSSYGHNFMTNWGIAKSATMVKDMEMKCGNGSSFKIIENKNEALEDVTVYEIMTETGSYQLENGIINICEEI